MNGNEQANEKTLEYQSISQWANEQARCNSVTDAPQIHAEVSAIAETGAQSDLWSLSDILECEFSRDDLLPVNISLSAAKW